MHGRRLERRASTTVAPRGVSASRREVVQEVERVVTVATTAAIGSFDLLAGQRDRTDVGR